MADDVDLANDLAQAERDRAVAAIRNRPVKPSALYCVECGDEIPKKRRDAVPGCQCCIDCATLLERRVA